MGSSCCMGLHQSSLCACLEGSATHQATASMQVYSTKPVAVEMHCVQLSQAAYCSPSPASALPPTLAGCWVQHGSRRKQYRPEPAQSCEKADPSEPAPPADLASGTDAAEAAQGAKRRREPALREVMVRHCFRHSHTIRVHHLRHCGTDSPRGVCSRRPWQGPRACLAHSDLFAA